MNQDAMNKDLIEEIVEEVTVNETGTEIDRQIVSHHVLEKNEEQDVAKLTSSGQSLQESSSIIKNDNGASVRSVSPTMPYRLLGEERPVKSPELEAKELEYFPPPSDRSPVLEQGEFQLPGSSTKVHEQKTTVETQESATSILRRRISSQALNKRASGDELNGSWRKVSTVRSAAASVFGSEQGDNSSSTGTWPRRISSGQRMGTAGAMGIGAGLDRRESMASLVSRGSGSLSLGRKNSIASLVQSMNQRDSFSGRASVVGMDETIMDVSDSGSSHGSVKESTAKEEEAPEWAGWFRR